MRRFFEQPGQPLRIHAGNGAVKIVNEAVGPELSDDGAHRFSAAADMIRHLLMGESRTTGKPIRASRRRVVCEQEACEPARHVEADEVRNKLLGLPKPSCEKPGKFKREMRVAAQVMADVHRRDRTDQRILCGFDRGAI